MNRQVLAREWLLFIGLVAFGLFVIPLVLAAVLPGPSAVSDFYSEFYNALVDDQEWWIADPRS